MKLDLEIKNSVVSSMIVCEAEEKDENMLWEWKLDSAKYGKWELC